MTTVVEKQKSYEQDLYESTKTQDKIKLYEDLLTSNLGAAQTSYTASAQQAASQASYDISGAYANYLKQQKSLQTQAGLEAGYKEEITGELKSAYGGAYQQAKTTEAATVASAQSQYAKDYASAVEDYNKSIKQLQSDITEEAKYKASLHSAAEQFAFSELTGDLYQPYTATDPETGARIGEGIYYTDPTTGEERLTDLGVDIMSQALLEGVGGRTFKQYLEEQGLTKELDYYLSADEKGTTRATQLHKDLFGITETKYQGTSEESLKRRLGTEGYIENIAKPKQYSVDDIAWDPKRVNNADTVESISNYAKSLGLTEKDVSDVLGGQTVQEYLDDIYDVVSYGRYAEWEGYASQNDYGAKKHSELISKLEQTAKHKYRG